MSQVRPATDKRTQVEAVVAALTARDFDALAEMALHPDVEMRGGIAALEGGAHHGVQGMRDWAKAIDSAFDDFTISLVEFREIDGERALVTLNNVGKAKASGLPVETLTHLVCTWRNGLLWRNEVYMHRADALEAVGLSE